MQLVKKDRMHASTQLRIKCKFYVHPSPVLVQTVAQLVRSVALLVRTVALLVQTVAQLVQPVAQLVRTVVCREF